MRKMFFVLCALMGFAFGQPLQDGIAAYNSKDYDKAIVNFTEAIRLNPKEATAFYNRGISYMAKGDNARAIADFEAVLRLNPSHDNAKSNIELARQRQSGGRPSATAAKTATVDELDISIRDASDYLNEKIPKGSKIVILNIQSNSSDLSDYIIDELIANAVNDGFFTVVDRQQLDAIRAEQKFQLSGAVDDKDALAIGKLFGAKTIVSGAVSRLGATGYRIRIRALEVQTAEVQGQFNRNIAASSVINSLMAGGGTANGGYATGTATATVTATANTPAAQASAPANKPGASPTIQGTMVPGSTLTEKLAWLKRSADSHNTYIVEVNADESIAPHTFEYKGAINITIVLKGDNVNRTIRLKSHGTMFTVGTNVTFILDNNITLQGHTGNTRPIVYVGIGMYGANGGTFKMKNGSSIIGNTSGGVKMGSGTFEMDGGTISGNTASEGAGVYVGNSAIGSGTFIMTGGTISGNTALKNGGGVYTQTATINIRGGTITGNTAREYGGGVYLSHDWAKFTKSGGTITGYNSDPNNGNVVKDDAGNVLARRGHAVYASYAGSKNILRRKETTAGPGVNLSRVAHKSPTGDWDQ